MLTKKFTNNNIQSTKSSNIDTKSNRNAASSTSVACTRIAVKGNVIINCTNLNITLNCSSGSQIPESPNCPFSDFNPSLIATNSRLTRVNGDPPSIAKCPSDCKNTFVCIPGIWDTGGEIEAGTVLFTVLDSSLSSISTDPVFLGYILENVGEFPDNILGEFSIRTTDIIVSALVRDFDSSSTFFSTSLRGNSSETCVPQNSFCYNSRV